MKANNEPQVRCPKCHAEQWHADRRGWRMLTGFIGSGRIIITCLGCGYQYRPGQQAKFEEIEASERAADLRYAKTGSSLNLDASMDFGRAIMIAVVVVVVIGVFALMAALSK